MVILTSVPILAKMIKKCDRDSARRRIHRQTDTHTDANRFYNPSDAICYSYGTDKKAAIAMQCSLRSCDVSPVILRCHYEVRTKSVNLSVA